MARLPDGFFGTRLRCRGQAKHFRRLSRAARAGGRVGNLGNIPKAAKPKKQLENKPRGWRRPSVRTRPLGVALPQFTHPVSLRHAASKVMHMLFLSPAAGALPPHRCVPTPSQLLGAPGHLLSSIWGLSQTPHHALQHLLDTCSSWHPAGFGHMGWGPRPPARPTSPWSSGGGRPRMAAKARKELPCLEEFFFIL